MYKQREKPKGNRSKTVTNSVNKKTIQGVVLTDNRRQPLQLGKIKDSGGTGLSHARKSFIASSLQSIGSTKDPRYITAMIMDSLTGYTDIYKAHEGSDFKKMPVPQTDEKQKTLSGKISRDAEMYIIDWVHLQLKTIIQMHRDSHKGSYDKEGLIKIELVGPRGTCTDCQNSLQRQLGVLNRLVHINLGRNYSVKLNARYTGYKVESTKTVRKYGSSSSSDKQDHWKWKAIPTGYSGPGPEPKKWMYDEEYAKKPGQQEGQQEPSEVDWKKE